MKTLSMQFFSGLRPIRHLAAAIALPLLALSFGAHAQLAPQQRVMEQKAQTGVRPEMRPIPACGCPPTVNFKVEIVPNPDRNAPVKTDVNLPRMLSFATGRFVGLTANGCEYVYQSQFLTAADTSLGAFSVSRAQGCPDNANFSLPLNQAVCAVAPTSYQVTRPPVGQPPTPYTCQAAPACRLVEGLHIDMNGVARAEPTAYGDTAGFCHYPVKPRHIDNNTNTRAAIQFTRQ